MNFASAEKMLPIAIHATDARKTVFRPTQVDSHAASREARSHVQPLSSDKPAADIAHLFGVETTQGANYSEEVYPGYPGLVMAGRRLKVMNWGFRSS
jgi:hypothetical protein